MKLLRLCLLVLLAVLLPVRGAMAATMLCTPAGGAVDPEATVVDHAAGHAHEGAAHSQAAQGHDPVQHGHGQGMHGDSTHDRCNVCSASCSSLPLPSASAGIAEPAAASASVSFPGLSAPVPTFQSGGQERPPRTT